MSSFYAELQVAGFTYPVRHCTYEFTQATGPRGSVVAKVRHGLVQLTLDVPHEEVLLDWAATAHKSLAGRVLFYADRGEPALETLAWEEGYCVGYQEEFASGDLAGAYICHLTLAASSLTLLPGGPGTYLSPAPGEHGTPPQALVDPLLLPLLAPATALPELVLPTVEELAATAAKALAEAALAAAAAAALPIVLTLGLLLGSSTPAGGPGIPQPRLVPISREELRLQELVAKHAAGTLTADEEAELIALLGTVKGIYVQSLQDLPTLPGNLPDANARPEGFITRINPVDEPENQLALLRENESATILAQAGYRVEQNPTIKGTTRNPDYLLEGRIFDCYSPTNSKPRSIATTLEGKIKKGQAKRFILNLEDSTVDIKALHQQLRQYPIAGLQEIIIIKQNQVVPFFP